MVKRKIKKKKKQVNQVNSSTLTSEQYARLISKFQETAKEKGERLFREHLKKGTALEQYAIQETSEKRKQKLIEQRLKSGLARGEEAEVKRQVEFATKTPIKRAFSRVSPSVRRADKKVGDVVRKAVHLLAPKGGMVRRITAPPKAKVSGKGRGRPRKSYKLRYVPGVGAVRVPTHIYNKMMAEVKAKRRLAEAQRQAEVQQRYEAEQMAMQQDPRFQPSAEEAWADSEDFEHEAEVQRLKQQQLMQQQMYQQQQPRGVIERTGDVMRRIGSQFTIPRYPQTMAPPQQARFYPEQPAVRREPVVRTISDKASILTMGNIFNRPENVSVGFKGRF